MEITITIVKKNVALNYSVLLLTMKINFDDCRFVLKIMHYIININKNWKKKKNTYLIR